MKEFAQPLHRSFFSVTVILLALSIGAPPSLAQAQTPSSTSTSTSTATLTLIADGRAQVAVYAPAAVKENAERARLRESVADLALYLKKMSGAEVPVHFRQPMDADRATPILVGEAADATFGVFTAKTDFQQSFRFVVSAKGVGLQGETDEATSYAVYELLDQLGCRWFIPGELGEVVPSRKTIELAHREATHAPGTVARAIWYADDAFKRRNRLGGFPYSAGHALESYVTKQQLEQHPEWNAEFGGVRKLHPCDVGHRICWANADVAAAVADKIIANLDQKFTPCVSISPGDGIDFCECEKCKKLDAGDWDPSMACVSLTDRYVNFVNRIAARVAEKHPRVRLGFLAYAQYTRPPVREKLHPLLIPQLAPITYCRAHTLDDANCESRRRIRKLLEGWGQASRNVAMYEYYFHLAEVAAPFPAIGRNVVELPVQYANHVTMWTPETMPNFESFTPGMCLGIRMSWQSQANPRDVLNDFYRNFYGGAAEPMAAYWQYVDDCWTTVPEHAGCGFGYMRRFTPERMAEARRRIDAALRDCQTPTETRRVQLAEESFRQHELFMKLRRDLFAGRHAQLEQDSNRWTETHQALAEKYKDNFTFSKTGWAPKTVAVSYFSAFYEKTYKDLARIGRDCELLTPALNQWSYAVDKEKQGETAGWGRADFADGDWKRTDVSLDSWSTLGLDAYYGAVWYRQRVAVPAVPAGKKIRLWVGATDGACKVFINGRHAPFVNAKGESVAEADGYCEPFSFDVTDAIKPGAENQITIVGTRKSLNELGTGGLLGPVLLYRER